MPRRGEKLTSEEIHKYALKKKYGITPEQYQELLVRQKYRCAICKRHRDEFNKRMSVDHDHTSGEIRGLLCAYCNHRVVGRHKRGGLLKPAADYLEREEYTGWLVPKKEKKRRRGKSKHTKRI